jgi:hypothetical protein
MATAAEQVSEGEAMSRSASRLRRKNQALCGCGNHALFSTRSSGEAVRARRDHPLCFRCWRAERAAARAREMAAARARARHFVAGPFALL